MPRDWKKVGDFADCAIMAKGKKRRLVEEDGRVAFEYDIEEGKG